MDEKELTIDMLKDTAINLNKLFDPPIQTEDVNLLKKDLKEVGIGLLDSDKDELSEETQKVLVSLGIKLPWDSEDVVMEIEVEEVEEVEEVKIKEIKNAKENNDNPIIDSDNDNDIDKNNNNDNNVDSRINNNDDADCNRMDNGDHENNKERNAEKVIKKISRISFYHQAIKTLCKDGATRQELTKLSDQLYKNNGGTAKFKATNISSITLNTLIEFGILIDGQNKKLKFA